MPKNYPEFDKEFPISLKYIRPLLNRVYARYPGIPKYQCTLIAKMFFLVLREELAKGEKISLEGLFSNLYLQKIEKKGIIPAHYKPKINPPESLRKFSRIKPKRF